MPKPGTAISTLTEIFHSAIESPRSTLGALKLLPHLVEGLQYSRTANFPPPPERRTNAPLEANPLLDYFNAHTGGPGLWEWLHYFGVYYRRFQEFICHDVHVLELGNYNGGSLGMWGEYFGKSFHLNDMKFETACMTYKTQGTPPNHAKFMVSFEFLSPTRQPNHSLLKP